MNTSSKTPGLFRRLTYKIPIFRSLKAYIFLLMLIIGIVPSDIMRLGILNNYEERAVNLRGSDVASQYRIIANHLVNYNYLQNPTSDVVNAELEQMSNLYDGRVLIINSNFRIVKDTYAMSEGKTMISEEVIKCFRGESTTRYDKTNGYIEMTVPITETVDGENGQTSIVHGVILASASTDSIATTLDILSRKALILEIVMGIIIIGIVFFFSHILIMPFKRVTQAISEVKDGFTDEPISVSGNRAYRGCLQPAAGQNEGHQRFQAGIRIECLSRAENAHDLDQGAGGFPESAAGRAGGAVSGVYAGHYGGNRAGK